MNKYQFFPDYKYFITYSSNHPELRNEQKEIILSELFLAAKETNVLVETFATLNNHVHIIISSTEQSIPKNFLKLFAGRSSIKINRSFGRSGKAWNKYYGWAIFNDKAQSNIVSYILGNPIRHGVVKSFDELYDYKYCSFRTYADEFSREEMERRVMEILKIKSEQDEEIFLRSLGDYGTTILATVRGSPH